ncbi:type I phosphodiesterase/nucleotide pyrophosphatase [Solidesulfovibrio fructosivorans JJ]]|uniref:Type I phosphodiesterase/nucleotide pyrophosphatase n=1 Tax=Solidesulfovibrio fructosivorans JJ] TaxID=596151 RepID=E1JSL9_SOLFR|nr:alkaline phosphatase family protein [Solidesulfovibrio fructosivorans]EFL52502.1 type I phosphodiesterase/nucleotide pyrophosphatase [Solidesulfovibrio fructosivorans JJ]]
MKASRVVVVGWDGATFDIVKPMIAAGRMPVLEKFLEAGVHAPLCSTVPPVTPVAWTSFATGCTPGRHGIFDALTLDPASHEVRFVSAAMRRAAPIWAVLSDRGRPAGAVNVPVTWPPDPISGLVISGMFTPSYAEDYVHPPELRQEIEARFGPCRDSPNMDPDPERYLQNLLAGVDARCELTLWLMAQKPLDYFCSIFMESDRVQHFFWGYRDPSHPDHAALGQAIEAVYERLDAALGRILDACPPDTAVALVSDHGAGPLRRAIFLNRWLMDNGFLTLSGELSALAGGRHAPSGLKKTLVALAKAILPESVLEARRKAKSKAFARINNLFSAIVDWDKTTCVSEGIAGGIFFNPKLVGEADRAELTRRLKEGLLAIVDPQTGAHPFAAVYAREELYNGPAVTDAPDVITLCAPGYQVLVPHEIALYEQGAPTGLFATHKWSGRHEQYGVFALRGPGVAAGVELADAAMADVTPTLLYALDEAVPENMDGHVLAGAFTAETLAARPPQTTTATASTTGAAGTDGAQADQIADELSDLGYM